MKTNQLIGAALDWAAAKCEGENSVASCYYDDDTPLYLDEALEPTWNPSTNWAQGGPIIEREGIAIYLYGDSQWNAHVGGKEMVGTTPLIAAMRCYVASKLGDEVEIPQELLEDA